MDLWEIVLIQNNTLFILNMISSHYQIHSHRQTGTLMHPFNNIRDDEGHNSAKRSNIIFNIIEIRVVLDQPKISGRGII